MTRLPPRRPAARCNLDGGAISDSDQATIDAFAQQFERKRARPRGALPTPSGRNVVDIGSVVMLPNGGVSLVVNGKPAPQGSKTPMLEEANPRTKPWRAAIVEVCKKLPADYEPLDGALAVDFVFFFDPPKYAKRGDLPTTKATYDWDKLSRAMCDGLTEGGVIVDDARIVDSTVKKRYVWPDEGEARAVVLVSQLRSP